MLSSLYSIHSCQTCRRVTPIPFATALVASMSFSNCQMAHHDASRFVIRYGIFEHAITENALAVLEEAIKNHGKPTSITTDRRSQFYTNASEVKKKGVSVFEKKMVKLGIKQILAGLRHSHIATLEKICNGFWIPEDIRFTVNVGAQVLQKV